MDCCPTHGALSALHRLNHAGYDFRLLDWLRPHESAGSTYQTVAVAPYINDSTINAARFDSRWQRWITTTERNKCLGAIKAVGVVAGVPTPLGIQRGYFWGYFDFCESKNQLSMRVAAYDPSPCHVLAGTSAPTAEP
jgi:hypothetical protein